MGLGLKEVDINLPLFIKGKVRNVYEVDKDRLLIVATDRISAFDVILPTPIPDKGKILTALSVFWMETLKDIVDNHLITADISKYPEKLKEYKDILSGRSMLVQKAERIPIECIVRGYLAGSGWKEYKDSGKICGISLPPNLKEAEKLPKPIFTPATKADTGHDENITQEQAEEIVGKELFAKILEISIALYQQATIFAEERDIIIADTKFEFGKVPASRQRGSDNLILIDEVLTPDSSRFWDKKTYKPGRSQPNFDKQFVRDYLETLDWDKTPPGPELPDDIVQKTREKYIEAKHRIIGE